MSERDAGPLVAEWRSSTARVSLVCVLSVLLTVLLVGPVPGASGQAAVTVGYVLAEALVLYVGYGALARVATPAVRTVLAST